MLPLVSPAQPAPRWATSWTARRNPHHWRTQRSKQRPLLGQRGPTLHPKYGRGAARDWWYHEGPVRAAWLLSVAIPLLSVSCAESTQPGPLPGASDAWEREPRPPPPNATPVPSSAPLDLYAAMQRWPAVNSSPFVSHGHQPEQLVDVRVNDLAQPLYAPLVPDTRFPDGAALAELAHDRSGLGYLMRKNAGTWSYAQLDARGRVLAQGTAAPCVRCHAQAPGDQVFGLPRVAETAP